MLENDTLTIENNKLKRSFSWNAGNLKSIALYNKATKQIIGGADTAINGDIYFPGLIDKPANASFKAYEVAGTNNSYPYLSAEVSVHLGGLELKRIFRVYADCPAIACDYYVRGKASGWKSFLPEGETLKNIEDETSKRGLEGKVPLAFFEVSNLPDEASALSKLMYQYKAVAKDLHAGGIFPIGREPSGFNWTGFQSVQKNKGYFLMFRENSKDAKQSLTTYLPAGKRITLKLIAGEGKSFNTVTGDGGSLVFALRQQKSFALYQYNLLP